MKIKIIFIFALLGVVLLGIHYYRITQVMPQCTIHFLTDVSIPQREDKVMVFSPHPDDETIGAGGYIHYAAKAGSQIRIVLVTDGNKHGLETVRYQEFFKATKLLGVNSSDLVFLGYPDGRVRKKSRVKLYNVFREQIESFQPTIVVYPHPEDHHADHAVCGEVLQAVLANERPQIAAYQYLVHHSRFPQPKKLRPKLYLLPPVRMVTFDKQWRRFMLTQDDVEIKKSALKSYKTQLRVPFLRSLLLSSIRKNELFAVNGSNAP